MKEPSNVVYSFTHDELDGAVRRELKELVGEDIEVILARDIDTDLLIIILEDCEHDGADDYTITQMIMARVLGLKDKNSADIYFIWADDDEIRAYVPYDVWKENK